MKRFYKLAAVTTGNGIVLDGRPLKTPLKAPLILPARALAGAIAAEWQGQGDEINPAAMHLTKLANTALDKATRAPDAFIDEVVEYAGSDLVCYRAVEPAALIARQAAAWDPVLAWARSALDAAFLPATGVMHRQQPKSALAAVRKGLGRESAWSLPAIHTVTTLTGSALFAIMLARGAIQPEAVWAAVHVDEDWQIEHWGWDEEARARRAGRLLEFAASCRFLELAAIPPAS